MRIFLTREENVCLNGICKISIMKLKFHGSLGGNVMKQGVFSKFMEKFLMPIAQKIENQKHLQAIKDGIIAVIPIIIIGSFSLIPIGIANLFPNSGFYNFINSNINYFNLAGFFTTNLMSLYAAFFIADSLQKKYGLNSSLIGITSVLCHLVLSVSIEDFANPTIWNISSLGAEGLFVSMIVSIVVVEISRLCKEKNFVIKMPDSVPPMVAESFTILIPLIINFALAIVGSIICMNVAGVTFPQLIMKLLAPAITSMDSLPAVMLVIFLTQLLWFFGLHGASITSSVWAAFAISYGAANVAAVAAGQEPQHVFTFGFYYGFLQVTGSGITLGLVFLMMRSKAKSLKAIGKLGIVPSFFGINEPVIFGAPLIMNPFMFIPFVFGPVIVAGFNYLAMSTGLVGLPLYEAPGFLPPGFQAFLLTLDWKAFVLAVFNVLFVTAVYYPFFKAMEKDELRKETIAEENANVIA